MKQSKRRKKSTRSVPFLILELLLTAVLLVAVFNLGKILWNYKKGDQFYDSTRDTYVTDSKTSQTAEPGISIDLSALRKANPDVVGWIDIPGTPVSYPLLFSGNDNDYLRHTYTHQYSIFGSIFIAQDCSADLNARHTLIYGHNTKNGSMFGSLKKYKSLNYANEHPYIYLLMPGKTWKYRIISAFTVTTSSSVYDIRFADDETFQTWINGLLEKSVINMQAPVVTGKEKILTLSTCTSRTATERFVVHAELTDTWTTSNGV